MYPSHAVCSASGVRVSVWGEEIGPLVGVLAVELHGEMMMMMMMMMMMFVMMMMFIIMKMR